MKATVALMLAIFCIGIDMYVVAALIPTMATELDEPVSALALLISAYALPTALLAPFFGPLSDRYGRRLVMTAGMAFFAVTVAGTAVAPSLGVLVVLRALNGLGAAAVMPAVFAYAGDLPTVTQRSRAMGNLAMGFPLASLLGLPLGSLLAGAISWRATFAAVAVLAVLATLLIWRLPADRAKGSAAIGYTEGLRFAIGNRKVLAVLAPERLSGEFGKFPTAKEQGLDVVGANWRGFYAPGKMSDEAYNFWVKSLGTVYDSKEWKSVMANQGMAPLNLRGEAFQKYVRDSVNEIQALSREIGIIK